MKLDLSFSVVVMHEIRLCSVYDPIYLNLVVIPSMLLIYCTTMVSGQDRSFYILQVPLLLKCLFIFNLLRGLLKLQANKALHSLWQ